MKTRASSRPASTVGSVVTRPLFRERAFGLPDVAHGKPALSRPHTAGLPPQLQTGLERLSGLSLGGVRVHYDSPTPSALDALAFTQGTDIHVAPGRESALAHEAWHVVQQQQARVRQTTALQGTAVNDDPVLEQEATTMGARAASGRWSTDFVAAPQGRAGGSSALFSPVQRAPAAKKQKLSSSAASDASRSTRKSVRRSDDDESDERFPRRRRPSGDQPPEQTTHSPQAPRRRVKRQRAAESAANVNANAPLPQPETQHAMTRAGSITAQPSGSGLDPGRLGVMTWNVAHFSDPGYQQAYARLARDPGFRTDFTALDSARRTLVGQLRGLEPRLEARKPNQTPGVAESDSNAKTNQQILSRAADRLDTADLQKLNRVRNALIGRPRDIGVDTAGSDEDPAAVGLFLQLYRNFRDQIGPVLGSLATLSKLLEAERELERKRDRKRRQSQSRKTKGSGAQGPVGGTRSRLRTDLARASEMVRTIREALPSETLVTEGSRTLHTVSIADQLRLLMRHNAAWLDVAVLQEVNDEQALLQENPDYIIVKGPGMRSVHAESVPAEDVEEDDEGDESPEAADERDAKQHATRAGQSERYPLLIRRSSGINPAAVRTHVVLSSGEVREDVSGDEVIVWDKHAKGAPTYRPIVLYEIAKTGTKSQTYLLGVVHTTPLRSSAIVAESTRTAIFGEIKAALASARHYANSRGLPVIIAGDYYLSPEALVEQVSREGSVTLRSDETTALGQVETSDIETAEALMSLAWKALEYAGDPTAQLIVSLRKIQRSKATSPKGVKQLDAKWYSVSARLDESLREPVNSQPIQLASKKAAMERAKTLKALAGHALESLSGFPVSPNASRFTQAVARWRAVSAGLSPAGSDPTIDNIRSEAESLIQKHEMRRHILIYRARSTELEEQIARIMSTPVLSDRDRANVELLTLYQKYAREGQKVQQIWRNVRGLTAQKVVEALGLEMVFALAGTNPKRRLKHWIDLQIADLFLYNRGGKGAATAAVAGLMTPEGGISVADLPNMTYASFWQLFSDHAPVGAIFSVDEPSTENLIRRLLEQNGIFAQTNKAELEALLRVPIDQTSAKARTIAEHDTWAMAPDAGVGTHDAVPDGKMEEEDQIVFRREDAVSADIANQVVDVVKLERFNPLRSVLIVDGLRWHGYIRCVLHHFGRIDCLDVVHAELDRGGFDFSLGVLFGSQTEMEVIAAIQAVIKRPFHVRARPIRSPRFVSESLRVEGSRVDILTMDQHYCVLLPD